MPGPFAVTAVSNSVFLDEDRQGEVGFTVSNQSGRSIEGRARLVAESAEAESWITLREPAQRTFARAGTERYMVDIDVPPDAPSGDCALRLDMIGVERPDEDYTRGQSVTFQVPEAESKSTTPFDISWRMIVAAVVLILAVGGVAWWFSGSDNGTVREVQTPVTAEPEDPIPTSTTLTDRPPVLLTNRKGVVIFAPYSHRDMDPDCTVTDVSARLLGAQGTIEVIEDAVGTNNLHVGVKYEADREMARAEITWEVEHPSDVECTVR